MLWSDILPLFTHLHANDARIDIRGVQYDSRRVAASEVFVAMRGETANGNLFIDAALQRGAAAIVTDSSEVYDELRKKQPELALALVEHGRRALAEVSSAVFGRPQDKLKVSAVTGTNGKTTTAFLLEEILRSAGRKCLLLGTIETHIGEEVRPSEHTTPESRDILALFAEAVRAGCTEVVMEMSSHALQQERVWGIPVDVAIFTNLTQDHLDYHGTMEEYAAAKARLFLGVGATPPRVAVVNVDDSYGWKMADAAWSTKAEVLRYAAHCSLANDADFRVEDISFRSGETSFRLVTANGATDLHSPLTGSVNVYNLVAASAAALARGLTLKQIAAATTHLRQVPGRFEVVPASREHGFTVVVDYAHTDDALRNLISLARDLVKDTGGHVITLFGCGGDRDRTKRPKMGRVAGELSDWVVLTSDNPRSENPMTIMAEALVNIRETEAKFVVEPDRRTAIQAAIRLAKPNDIVLLAGKGHEKTQILANGAIPFDDVAEAEQALRERKEKG